MGSRKEREQSKPKLSNYAKLLPLRSQYKKWEKLSSLLKKVRMKSALEVGALYTEALGLGAEF